MLCLFVKVRQHCSCAVSPSDTTVWPRSLFALLIVTLPQWLARPSSHPNQGPLHTVRTAPRSSRTPVLQKEDCEINVQNWFAPIAQSSMSTHTHIRARARAGTHNRGGATRQTKRQLDYTNLTCWAMHVYYSQAIVASSMNTAGQVITDHHLKSTKKKSNF